MRARRVSNLTVPSVPSATLTPRSSRSCTRHAPEWGVAGSVGDPSPHRCALAGPHAPDASFMLETGQCTTLTPASAQRAISSSFSCVMCTAMRRSQTTPSLSRFCRRQGDRARAVSVVQCRRCTGGTHLQGPAALVRQVLGHGRGAGAGVVALPRRLVEVEVDLEVVRLGDPAQPLERRVAYSVRGVGRQGERQAGVGPLPPLDVALNLRTGAASERGCDE